MQDALVDFEGSLVIVSHDVDFLNPIVDKIIEVKNKSIQIFIGNFNDYLARKEAENSEDLGQKQKNMKSYLKTNINHRKFQKRIKAERRQKFYLLTKDIKKRIELLKEEISKLENQKKTLENFFVHPEEASPNRNIFREYKELSERIDLYFDEWSHLSDEYSRIEREIFNNN